MKIGFYLFRRRKHKEVEIDEKLLTPRELLIRRFLRHKLAVCSLSLLTVLYFIALFAPAVAPYPKGQRNLDYIFAPPTPVKFSFSDGLYFNLPVQQQNPITLSSYYIQEEEDRILLRFMVKGDPYRLLGLIPCSIHFVGVPQKVRRSYTNSNQAEPRFYLLGADRFGRDLFSRIVFGSQISLSIGLLSIFVSAFLGILFGGISGYLGGKPDLLIQRIIEIMTAIPSLPLWLALAAVVPPDFSSVQSYFTITIVLSLLGWTGLARVVRGKILSLREEDYALAAKLLGANHRRILFRHLVPGFTSHIIVQLSLSIPVMILGETSLSFLGLGLRPPVVSWGVMLQDCMSIETVAHYPWILIPVFFIMITVLAFNFLGDGLRDAADPYAT